MSINYRADMKFSTEGRNALKQDFSDFYHMINMEIQDKEDKKYVEAWAKKYQELIVTAVYYLVKAEKGQLDESDMTWAKEMWLALHAYYETIHYNAKIHSDLGYQAHNDSFLMKFN